MSRVRGIAAFALLLAAALALYAGAQEETLHVSVRLVNVFVNVTDQHGAPVPDLAKKNFAITEDGAPQTIAVFERQTNVPLSVVLAIDTSGSTRRDMGAEQAAARDFVRGLLTPRDELALFDFNSDVREVVPFTSDPRRVDDGLGRLSKGPATAFYDAVLLGSQALAPRGGRKVMLVISDGGDTVNETTFEQALAAAQKGEVMIYSLIDVPIEADAGRDTAGEHAMITLSQETGGRAFYVDQMGLRAALRKVSDDLRTQYLLAYYPHLPPHPADPLAAERDTHSIHITLENVPPGAEDTAHYRTEYYRAASHR